MTQSDASAPAPDTPPSRKRSRLREWAGQILLMAAVYLGVSQCRDSGLLASGTVAPTFTLPSVAGSPVSLEQWRGKAVLLHFWATWCGVCKMEISTLKRLQASLDEGEVLLTIVHPSAEPDAVQAFLAEQDIHYPVLTGNQAVFDQYRVHAFPTNYFVAPDGTISSANSGMSSGLGLSARLGCAALGHP